jgi:GDP-4-dehydro-6-deoxy-D-mannose reductase
LKALIIGASGFVGRYLIEELYNSNYEICATKLSTENLSTDKADVIDLDITNMCDIEHALRIIKPDVIFHLAAQSSVAVSWILMEKTFEINTLGTLKLLTAINNVNKNIRVLLVGSSEEYGFNIDTKMPVNELTEINPSNPYAISKATQTMIGKMFANSFNLNVIMVRSFNHIGPFQPVGFAVPDFCNCISKIEKNLIEPVIEVGNLSAKRDFTDVRDVVKGYVCCMKDGKKGEIYNIGSGKAVSIEYILNNLISFSNKRIQVKVDTNKFRPIDVQIVEADISKAKKEINYKVTFPLEDTLKKTLDYWRGVN